MKEGARRRPRPATLPEAGARVVRVLTDVAGVDKEFDYVLPDRLAPDVRPGSQVRVDLAGRRVGGWVVGVDVEPRPGLALRPLGKVRGWGPEPAVLDLAGWARLALGQPARLPADHGLAARRGAAPPGPRPAPATGPAAQRPARGPRRPARPSPSACRPPPTPRPLVAELAQRGPLLVVVPSASRAGVLAGRLRRAGGDVALLPERLGPGPGRGGRGRRRPGRRLGALSRAGGGGR